MSDLLDAQRANDLYVGRRAILDRELEVHAYELINRHDPSASADDVALALATIAIHGDLDRLASGQSIWMRTTPAALATGFAREVQLTRLVLEVRVEALDDPAAVAELQAARNRGIRVSVSDHPNAPVSVAMPDCVDLVRVHAETVRPVDLAGRLQALRQGGIRILADGVRSHIKQRWLSEAGVDLFEGIFLTEPDVVETALPSNRLSTLRLIAELDRDEIEIDAIEKLVSQDVALSFQILRYVNSAFVGLRSQVSSIRQAVVLLGPPTVRQVAAVALMSSDDKPVELVRTALVRAKLCEGLAKALKEPPSSYYTAGLFSSLEAMTDSPLAAVLEELPLTDEVRDAILDRTGPIGRAIRAAIAHERCDWDDPALAFFDDDALSSSYFTAITWVDEVLHAIAGR